MLVCLCKTPLPLKSKQAGVALITVMLIVALAAILASEMTLRLQTQLQRTANINANQQAYWYAMGAEAFVKQVLKSSFKDEPNITHLGQIWAKGKNTFPVAYGEISGEINDLQACLNLNALRIVPDDKRSGPLKKAPARLALEKLLITLELDDVDQFDAESMGDALTDWLDEDSAITSAGGAEDNDYAAREFPYLAANNYLASINELRVVEHFSLAVITALKPYVCILPQDNLHQININTINNEHAELLAALLGASVDEAQSILSARPEDGFENIDEFLNLPELKQIALSDEQKQQFVVDSEYFTLSATASFNNSFLALNSILKVNKKQKIYVISRTIGHN